MEFKIGPISHQIVLDARFETLEQAERALEACNGLVSALEHIASLRHYEHDESWDIADNALAAFKGDV